MQNFVHLHVHSQYSILDGASSVEGLVGKAKACGMPAIALTDHGTMFGIKHFHQAAKKEGIKPIVGMEAYVARGSRHDKETPFNRSGYHLILLAKNEQGYNNLVKLCSYGYTEGFYYKPRIDRELLEKYHEGIIISSACLGGEVPQHIMNNDISAAEETIKWYKSIFGEDYYLELQLQQNGDPKIDENVYENQLLCNKVILELGKKHDVKVIATNDAHFLNAEDADAHDVLICLNTGRDRDDETRMRYTRQEYIKTQEEMFALFGDHPEVLANTLEIADKVEEYELNKKPIMPDFEIPEGFTDANDYLRHITYEGAKERWGEDLSEEITERLDFELQTIKDMGFPDYFLIVWDFIKAAREMGVLVGPGRGSAAGSAVAYCIKITNIDPLAYSLLFERFLNPDRISMPDIDIDFDDDGRQLVLDWVAKKYGKEKVAHIVTFGTMAAKMAIRDVARVLKLPLAEANRLAKLIPDGVGVTLKKAEEQSPEFKQELNSQNPLVVETLELASKLEGSVRQTGIHACGVIIGKDKLENYIPIMPAKDSDLMATQYDGRFVESIGMLKMDFLGLKTLSILKEAVANIKLSKGIDVDIDTIPLDDEETFKLFSRGDTTGIFQFESPGMKKHLRSLQPNRIEDLVAMNALYRPGPMEYIPSYIRRKHGKEDISYDHPLMETYLKTTYGITVFQEQVMLLSRSLGGFTRGQSDSLRKAMGKKKIEEMNKLKKKFISGCLANEDFVKDAGKEPKKLIDKIWKDWEAFAKYAFNKSHSVCYADVAYKTGYLKAHYPAEFMAAVLSRNFSDIKKVSIFMDECQHMDLDILGPDVNESHARFMVNKDGAIRFGMAAIKGVGANAVNDIIREREKGTYSSIYDFFERVNLSSNNRRTLENLTLAGGFDSFGFKRSQFFQDVDGKTVLENLISYGQKIQSESNMGMTLFGEMQAETVVKPEIPYCEPWSKMRLLSEEKELVGIYLSAHPLDEYKFEIQNFANTTWAEVNGDLSKLQGKTLNLVGLVTSHRTGYTKKKNDPYGVIDIEDASGSYQLFLFSKNFFDYRNYMVENCALFIKATVEPRRWGKQEGDLQFQIKKIQLLSEVRDQYLKSLTLHLFADDMTEKSVEEIVALAEKYKGNKKLKIHIQNVEGLKVKMYSTNFQVNGSNSFFKELDLLEDVYYTIN
ncbi:DNA polymerase III alpha subunit [Balneicella halophila]|uniref:DNA polymerase III subunit alpha n=1 Tax=Balneicella halophila TaxID=1537566 RepID=A0A7L4UMY1_BALHA|nr:DNA polymerase III subunit alpha [Balneicella halophila]PVX49889.1 DNA polymerase III alpha subunit [Balneicella halophila]